MAEAVAALGLAANIFQFLQYGTKFVGIAWTICKSGPESVEAFSSLQSLSNNIKNIIDQLQPNTADISGTEGRQSDPERAIFAAAAECFNDAQRILDSLDKVGAKDLAVAKFGRKRESGKAAFKLMWKSSDIQALEIKFERLKTQITLNLVASVRCYALQTLDKQNEILRLLVEERGKSSRTLPDEELQRAADENGFGSTIVEFLTTGALRSRIRIPVAPSMLSALESIEKGSEVISTEGGDDLELTLSPERRKRMQARILKMLSYSGMDNREHSVAEAHEATFRWAFESGQTWESLGDWLESDHELYWVTGKAGSGKSTLMKYICEAKQSEDQASVTVGRGQPRCLQHLRKWAGDATLTVTSFYFWTAGTSIQTSKEGLYRTLLYKLLSSHIGMMEHVFPRHWRAMSLFDQADFPISILDLKTGLQKLVSLLTKTKIKVCLFVDGLDEFDGDHEELVQYLQGLLTTNGNKGYLKVCVASRPWVVFGDAFLDRPSLRLEDLTFNDIKDYVASRFQGGRRSAELLRKEPEFTNGLINEVVQKASGVFLWANLVVTSLLDGIKHGDRISDLRQRLDELPRDLEDLYTRILDSLDPRYLEHAAQYFSLVEAHQNTQREPATVLLLSFADDELEEATNSARVLDDSIWTAERLQFRIDNMKTRLNSRCKGFIETIDGGPLDGPEGGQVQYLHRSVKDYIQTTAVQARLTRALTSPFNPHLRLCAAFSSFFKLARSSQKGFLESEAWVDRWACCLVESIRHSELVADGYVKAMVQVLDQTEQAFQDITEMDIHEAIESSLRSTLLKSIRDSELVTDGYVGPMVRVLDQTEEEFQDIAEMDRHDAIESSFRSKLLPPALCQTCQMSFVSIVIKSGGLRYLAARIARSKVRPLEVPDHFGTCRSLTRFFKMCGTRNDSKMDIGKRELDSETHRSLAYMLADAVTSLEWANPIRTISFLLECGADVNQICDLQVLAHSLPAPIRLKASPWVLVLAGLICSSVFGPPLVCPWHLIAPLMLRFGADVSDDAFDKAALVTSRFYGVLSFSEHNGPSWLERGGKGRIGILKRLRDYQKRGGELNLRPVYDSIRYPSGAQDPTLPTSSWLIRWTV